MDLGIVAVAVGFLLVLVGIWGILTRKNIIKIVIGFSVFDTGLHMVMVGIGYVKGGTAPILSKGLKNNIFVDPLPQAMVLTAIVIGLATTALLLAVAIRIYKKYGTFDIREIKKLKG
ncbi:MAG: cation:proton antiporter [Spirochaetes bacterium]|nr:MAG: cation:proton antiporter [Spirochaetota bacterium]